ncbi:MAG: oxidoreductase [Firmicutes bacterium HGW-Firmicutes-16]|nr:MAG: oxidoreductase [Firmicutes bacterium HGW-Firmicutes-16]
MNIDNKVILITGASSGIGRATALMMAGHNNRLVIVARRENLLREVSAKIRDQGSECLYFAGDAMDEQFGEYVVRKTVEAYGGIDIAIMVVGIGPPSNTLTASSEKIKFCMDANFDTFINFYVPIMRQMKTQKTECMISHVNSLASFFGVPMQGDYVAAKGGVRLFLDTARMELKHFGYKNIHIQTIHPSFVDTEAVRNDGIPAPGEISEEKSAEYIIKGIKKNTKRNMFPFTPALLTRLSVRVFTDWLITKVELSQTPKNY